MKLYLNLFDFDQLLISIQIGSIEATCISHTLNTVYQWSIHYLPKWINSSCQWMHKIHYSLQQTNTSVIIFNDGVQCETISCLPTLIFDCLTQTSTRI
ncbi:unnamed protein product [Rotaria sordida]|uniref:Uncharacterized protein n=1 Tax=Rotaria sordida TaxID=392033 RepID=A0A815NX93_9BILA|nr:unnamed protein product [Rotaria sordida]CAF1440353.1 unnamed protein product [Rotaria sordida]